MVNLRNILPAWIASKKTHHRPDESFIDDFRKIDFIQESYKKYNKILVKSFIK